MKECSPPVQALIESARRSRTIELAVIPRIEAATKGIRDVASLTSLLQRTVIPGVDAPQRLLRLLARPGWQVGAYEMLARLPSMTGQSWLAADAEGELVVVRMSMNPQTGTGIVGETAERRFRREAEVCLSLDHPNLIRFLDGGTDEQGQPWFALEFHQGSDLTTLLRLRGGRLDAQVVLGIGWQVAAALAALSERQLVHRNVSPQSILVAADGTTKLGEFALIRQQSDALTQVSMTQPGAGVEPDPRWTAPELLLGVDLPDIQADVYSLGCVLHACLAGAPPFAGQGHALMHAHRTAPIPNLQQQGVEGPVSDAIGRCLAKEAWDRPAPNELSGHLRQLRDDRQQDGPTRMGSGTWRRPTTGRQAAPTGRRLVIRGSLAELHLGDVLQTLQRTRSSGLLELSGGVRTCCLALADGVPIGIDVDDQGRVELQARLAGTPVAQQIADADLLRLVQGEHGDVVAEALAGMLVDAVCQRLLGSDELVDFTPCGPADEPAVEQRFQSLIVQRCVINVDHLLLEAARQADEWERLIERLPGGWAIPQVAEADRAVLAIECATYPESAILAVIDGRTAWQSIPEGAACSHHAVASLLLDLQERALVRWLPAGEAMDLALHDGSGDLVRAALTGRPGCARSQALFANWLARNGVVDCASAAVTATATAVAEPPAPVAAGVRIEGDPATALTSSWIALVSHASGSGPAVQLYDQEEIIIGKLAKAPVHLTLRKYPETTYRSESNRISRQHCVLRHAGPGWTVMDLGSGNGTGCDGARLPADQPMALTDGTIIDIAGVVQCAVHLTDPVLVPKLPGQRERRPISSLILRRLVNRAELSYVACRGPVVIGGTDLAAVHVPGLTTMDQFIVARHEGRWLWTDQADPTCWHPLVANQRRGPLVAVAGDHAYFH